MDDIGKLVTTYASLIEEGKNCPLGTLALPPPPVKRGNTPTVAIFAPHPDDEVIIGALPLRLARESGWNIVDVPVTLGSKLERRPGRLEELRNCLQYIGFHLESVSESGLDQINVEGRAKLEHWRRATSALEKVLLRLNPKVIFFPHEADWNSTHIGTHYLVMDALKRMPADYHCYTVETEYWAPLRNPNLMVETSAENVADLVRALSFHKGELERNPYHLTLPAWMMDNVRRGSELLSGKGATASSATFATLYRVRRFAHGDLHDAFETNRILLEHDAPASLFP